MLLVLLKIKSSPKFIIKNSRQFFLVNQTSCTDWLIRTSLPLMGVAFSIGNFAQIVRLAGFIFAELERTKPPNGGKYFLF
jgi:hypothetical protein